MFQVDQLVVVNEFEDHLELDEVVENYLEFSFFKENNNFFKKKPEKQNKFTALL